MCYEVVTVELKNYTFVSDTRSPHPEHLSFLPPGGTCNLPTIPSASDFNTVLSSDQNTLDGTHSQHSQHSTSQDDLADIEEGNQCPVAVQLADAQVLATDAVLLPRLRVDLLPSFRLQLVSLMCLHSCPSLIEFYPLPI